MEKIIAAFEKEKNALYIRDMVEAAGLAEVQLCRSGMEVRRVAGVEPVSTVVCGYKLADGSTEALFDDLPPGTSMLMIAGKSQLELCGAEGIFKLVAPVHREELLGWVHMLVQLGQRLERMTPAQRNERADVERAKALLMARQGFGEEEAHRFLQKQSMDRGNCLEEMARLVLNRGYL